MQRIEVSSAGGPYAVLVGRRLTPRLGAILDGEGVPPARAVVTNTTVGPLWGRLAATALACPPPLELPDGEEHKRWPQVETICGRWLAEGVHRGATVAAVGGGVVTDLVGFAAAVYLRGVAWLAVPTTLLAMVDAAVGGKTGVNLDQGKNLVGAFWPPRLVVVDVETLATLPVRELRAGLAEVVKAAWIGDRGLLDLLDLLDPAVTGFTTSQVERWQELVLRAIQVKARVVTADEREAGPRRALNLGHTLGHALEAATGFGRFLHGEAVAWGLLAAVRLGRARGLLSDSAARRLRTAVTRLGPWPALADVPVERVLAHLFHDKKRDDLGVLWVLPTDDGVLFDQRVTAEEVREVLAALADDGLGSA